MRYLIIFLSLACSFGAVPFGSNKHWTPKSLTEQSNAFWLTTSKLNYSDAAGTVPAAVGDQVKHFHDYGQWGNHYTNSAGPVLLTNAGYRALKFQSDNQLLRPANLVSNINFTVIVLGSYTNLPSTYDVVSWDHATAFKAFTVGYLNGQQTFGMSIGNATTGNNKPVTTEVTAGTRYIQEYRMSGDWQQWSFVLNGNPQGTFSRTDAQSNTVIYTTPIPLAIGGANSYYGQLEDVIFVQRLITDDERAKLIRYYAVDRAVPTVNQSYRVVASGVAPQNFPSVTLNAASGVITGGVLSAGITYAQFKADGSGTRAGYGTFRFGPTIDRFRIDVATTNTIKFIAFRPVGPSNNFAPQYPTNLTFLCASEAINLTTTGDQFITLGTPLTGVQEGDVLGVWLKGDATASASIKCQSDGTTTGFSWVVGEVTSGTNDFSLLSTATKTPCITAYGPAPQLGYIGDSICAGHMGGGTTTTYCWNWLEAQSTYGLLTNQPATYISRILGMTNSYVVNAQGGQTWTGDVVNGGLKFLTDAYTPNICIMSLGLNDIAAGMTATNIWVEMNQYFANIPPGKKVWVCEMTPDGTQDATASANIVLANAMYSDYCTQHGATLIPVHDLMGTFTGGKWIVNAAYDADGVHFNSLGVSVYCARVYSYLNGNLK